MENIYTDDIRNKNPLILNFSKKSGLKFNSFTDMQQASPKFKDFVYVTTGIIKNNSGLMLIEKLLHLFPYYFFSNLKSHEKMSLINLLNDTNKFKYTHKLKVLFSISININLLRNTLNELKLEGFEFDYKNMITSFFKTTFEYSFITLTTCVKNDSKHSISDLFEEYLLVRDKVGLSVSQKYFVEYFNTFIANTDEQVRLYARLKDLFLNDQTNYKIIFSSIYFNLKHSNPNLSNYKRNQILRPIFFMIISSFTNSNLR